MAKRADAIPHPSEASAELRSILARIDEQRRLLTDEEREIAELRQKRANDPRTPRQREEDSRVNRLLGRAGDEPSDDVAREKQLTQSTQDRRKAIKILETEAAAERVRASKQICEELKPLHTKLVHEICKAFVTLHGATLAYDDFLSELERKDVAYLSSFNSMRTARWLGKPRDKDSHIATFLRTAIQNCGVPANIIPMELRK